jgi:hypothetical protein
MSLPWTKLFDLQEAIPVSDLGVSLDCPVASLPLIGESPFSIERFSLKRWFKIGPHQFIHTRDDSLPHFAGFAWAASDGAFACALARDLFFDDKAPSTPPSVLLPEGGSFGAADILRAAQTSGARFHDVILDCIREIYFRRCYYYYRATEPYESPICIRVAPGPERSIGAA